MAQIAEVSLVPAGYYEFLHKLLPRYMRVRDLRDMDSILKKLASILPDSQLVHQLDWMPSFICLPGYVPISSWKPLELGLYPMDIASALAVDELLLGWDNEKPVTVLDLCCCPGSKFQTISDTLEAKGVPSTVIGVDISEKRMNICKNLVMKWSRPALATTDADGSPKPTRQLLFRCDGTKFKYDGESSGELIFDSWVFGSELNKKRKRMNKSARMREKKQLLASNAALRVSNETEGDDTEGMSSLCDLVLVDAECSHDGSYRHMRYCGAGSSGSGSGGADGEEDDNDIAENPIKPAASIPYSTEEQRSSLESLQRGLLLNGFRQLKPGGTLVYSTCSHEDRQNEDIVTWFLRECPDAALVPCRMNFSTVGDSVRSSTTSSIPQPHGPSVRALLELSPAELVTALSGLSEEACRQKSDEVCAYVSSAVLLGPLVGSGKIPGTVRLSKDVGMSGLFIAKFTKTVAAAAEGEAGKSGVRV